MKLKDTKKALKPVVSKKWREYLPQKSTRDARRNCFLRLLAANPFFNFLVFFVVRVPACRTHSSLESLFSYVTPYTAYFL
jgi:hypothetical protein